MAHRSRRTIPTRRSDRLSSGTIAQNSRPATQRAGCFHVFIRRILVTVDRKSGNFTRSEEHTSELQSLMRISYAVFCLKKKKTHKTEHQYRQSTYYTNY